MLILGIEIRENAKNTQSLRTPKPSKVLTVLLPGLAQVFIS